MNNELMSRLYDESKVYRDTEWGEKVQFFDHRKFAELIIKECIDKIGRWDQFYVDDENKVHHSNLTEHIIMDIKEHFGVK